MDEQVRQPVHVAVCESFVAAVVGSHKCGCSCCGQSLLFVTTFLLAVAVVG